MSSEAGGKVRRGADSGEQIFIAVGGALTCWEQCEDEIMWLFQRLAGDTESLAIEQFAHAPRSVRKEMLLLALKSYQRHGGAAALDEGTVVDVTKALKKTDKLAAFRNEMVHGSCSSVSSNGGGASPPVEGFFIVPARYKPNTAERLRGHLLAPDDIAHFIADVTACREVFAAASARVFKGQSELRSPKDTDASLLLMLARDATTKSSAVEHFLEMVQLSPAAEGKRKWWKAVAGD